MADAMLEEIWRVRAELIKQHGGWDGYVKYAQKLEQSHARRQKRTATRRKPRKRVAAKLQAGSSRP